MEVLKTRSTCSLKSLRVHEPKGPPQAAIYYHPDGFRTDRTKLMGRHSAGEGFLRAYLRHCPQEEYACVAASRAHAEEFGRAVRELRPEAKVRWRTPHDWQGLSDPGAVMLPGPDLAAAAWRRRRGRPESHSLIGVTHTTATHRVMDSFGAFLTSPVEPWDALICTSRAVAGMTRRVLEDYAAFLRERLGARRFVLPELPVIPLGVHSDDFADAPSARTRWREKLGIGAHDAVALYFGRLTFSGKTHPGAMFLAMEQAASRMRAAGDLRPLHLVLGGWFASDDQEKLFRQAAAQLAPSVTLHVEDGRPAEARRTLWGVADLFVLLVDNIQETYGLAPVEAMAAGLPVVVTDWDGFKDTVGHSVHGFRIPTWTPQPGLGADIAAAFEDAREDYDGYLASTANFTAVDIGSASEAMARLFMDGELRARMSAAARAHVAQALDWSVVIQAYRKLWAALAERRADAPQSKPIDVSYANPLRADPFRIFASYPSATLSPKTLITFSETVLTHAQEPNALLGAAWAQMRKWPLAEPKDVKAMLDALGQADGSATAGDLIAALPDAKRARAFRSILWMAKHDVLAIRAPTSPNPAVHTEIAEPASQAPSGEQETNHG
jgi:alpha-maltose-1-phosphate synthase